MRLFVRLEYEQKSCVSCSTYFMPIPKEDVLQAVNTRKDYCFSYWDSLIVACALRCHCRVLLTEDMQHDLTIYQQLKVYNPF